MVWIGVNTEIWPWAHLTARKGVRVNVLDSWGPNAAAEAVKRAKSIGILCLIYGAGKRSGRKVSSRKERSFFIESEADKINVLLE